MIFVKLSIVTWGRQWRKYRLHHICETGRMGKRTDCRYRLVSDNGMTWASINIR